MKKTNTNSASTSASAANTRSAAAASAASDKPVSTADEFQREMEKLVNTDNKVNDNNTKKLMDYIVQQASSMPEIQFRGGNSDANAKKDDEKQEALTSQLLPLFIKCLVKLLEALSHVFVDCKNTIQMHGMLVDEHYVDTSEEKVTSVGGAPPTAAAAAKAANKPKLALKTNRESLLAQSSLIRVWDSIMSPYYSEILDGRHARVFENNKNHPIFLHLKLRDKFYDKNNVHNQASLLNYINHLNAFACFYCGIPTKLLETFETLSKEIEEDLKNECAEDGSELTFEQTKKRSTESITKRLPVLIKRLGSSLSSVNQARLDKFMTTIPTIVKFLHKVPMLEKTLHAVGFTNAFKLDKSANASSASSASSLMSAFAANGAKTTTAGPVGTTTGPAGQAGRAPMTQDLVNKNLNHVRDIASSVEAQAKLMSDARQRQIQEQKALLAAAAAKKQK